MSTVPHVFAATIRPFNLWRSPLRCSRYYASTFSSSAKLNPHKSPQTSELAPKSKQAKLHSNPHDAGNAKKRVAKQEKSLKQKSTSTSAGKAPTARKAQEKPKLDFKRQLPNATGVNLSGTKYESLIYNGRLDLRMAETIPYQYTTWFQKAALSPILSGNNALVQSPDRGLATAYLVPVIAKHINWGNKEDRAPISLPSRSSKLKPFSPSLSEIIRNGSGPASTKLIVVCPTAGRALAVAAKCIELVPERGPISVVSLTHVTTPEHEREWVIKRPADILVTTPFPILDHIILTKHFNSALVNLKCVVFDNADNFTEPKWLPALNKLLLTERVPSPAQVIVSARKETDMLKIFIETVLGPLQYKLISGWS